MLNDLVRNLMADQVLNSYVHETTAQWARPSDLETTATFDDTGGLFPNGRLDGGESGNLLIKVRNRGTGPAFAVRLQISPVAKAITVPTDTEVGDLPPGGEREISIPVAGGIGLDTAVQSLPINTLEKRGYGGRPLVLEIATEKLKRPTLEIVDISLNDRGSRLQGDGDGRPSNGETFEAVVRIRNSGPGEAAGVVMTVASVDEGVELPEPRAEVPLIKVNELAEARLLVRLPVAFEKDGLSLTFRAVEIRGPEVAQTSKIESWALQLKKPLVAFTYRLYDGNSSGSLGDRDGVANNGESLELAFTPVNRGALAARDVRISLVSQQLGVTLSRSSFEVGDLPAQAEGAEQRVGLKISRTLGRDVPIDELVLIVTVTQQSFPQLKEAISFSFQSRHPELVSNVTNSTSLVEGGSGVLLLELRNQGFVAAEGVQVEVSTDNQGLELLDESGVPARNLHIDVGTLDARSATPTRKIRVHCKRNLSTAEALLRVVAIQNDFPTVEGQTTLRIEREAVAVISAIPPSSVERAPSSVTVPLPAAISFLQYSTGEHLISETVDFRFEIQSSSKPLEVRLTQNQRLLSLQAPTAVVTGIFQYELPIHLDEGENDLEVVVVTDEGVSKRTLSLIRDQNKGRLWVVAIGVNDYSDPSIRDLQFAEADARAVDDYFRDTFKLTEDQLFLRIGAQASLREIKSVLGTQLVARANNPNDTIVLYFAGHGVLEANGLSAYLLPHDATLTDLYSTAFEIDEISNILRRLRPDRIVVILDSCFSGARGGRTPDLHERAIVTSDFAERMAGAGRGRIVLAASEANQSAQEDASLGHGVFTYYVLKGLRGGADFDSDGEIDTDEVFRYVSKAVEEFTSKQQRPERRAPNSVGQIVIGRSSIHTGPSRQ
jgi:hypothetical protein